MRAPLRLLIEVWALLGGAILLALVLINAYSVVAGLLFNAPLAGQFELVEMGVAIAAFAFLPYCQMIGANVTADIFTSNAGPKTKLLLSLLAGLVALTFSVVLTWRMWLGFLDYREFPEFTAIMSIPIWYAYVPIVASLVLFVLACLLTVGDAMRDLSRDVSRPGPGPANRN